VECGCDFGEGGAFGKLFVEVMRVLRWVLLAILEIHPQ